MLTRVFLVIQGCVNLSETTIKGMHNLCQFSKVEQHHEHSKSHIGAKHGCIICRISPSPPQQGGFFKKIFGNSLFRADFFSYLINQVYMLESKIIRTLGLPPGNDNMQKEWQPWYILQILSQQHEECGVETWN